MAKDLFYSLDLNLLRTFLVLSQELNMRKASERLFVSQPAISQALQKLRHHFNDELFVKSRHGLNATSYCDDLAEGLSPILDDLSNLLNAKIEFEPKLLTGTINIALSPIVLSSLSGTIFTKIRRLAPNVELHLLNWKESTLDDIAKGKITYGVNYECTNTPKELLTKKLIDTLAKVIVRENHPIKKNTVTVYDVEPYEIASLIIPGWNNQKSLAQEVMTSHGLEANIGFRSELPMAILDVIQQSDMYYPSNSIFNQTLYPQIRVLDVELSGVPLTYSIYGYYHLKHRKNPMHQWLHGVIQELLDDSNS
ncbi:LysR family transcriptional regulator [Aliivibrio kagoshimensis]|uniref:LysR family transcriptional regulator n=1 Tax=Aliivibrio kagoshimensis TaxID=2910230 RepID=UPI003D0F175F